MKRKALVVDDNPTHRFAIVAFLKIHQFEVDTANDGIMALSMLKDKKYDLMFSDIEMPNMNGLELLAKARKMFDAIALPIVMLSSLKDIFVIKKAASCGANTYMTKPYSIDKMNKVLRKLGMQN